MDWNVHEVWKLPGYEMGEIIYRLEPSSTKQLTFFESVFEERQGVAPRWLECIDWTDGIK